jgi:glycosyltransferase involved in cell wall biosynthesis
VREALLTYCNGEHRPLLLLFGKAKAETLASLSVPYQHVSYADAVMLRKLYNATDLLLLPSLQDNLPNTAMEALSCGTPVVAFRTGGIPEMVKHGTTGYLVPQGNVKQLHEGIRFVLAQKTSAHMRLAARQHVLNHYSPAVVAKRYQQLYVQLKQSKH